MVVELAGFIALPLQFDNFAKHFLMAALDNHIVLALVPAYGHIRAISILATRLVKENSGIVVTVIVSPNYLDNTLGEVLAELGDSASEDHLRKRIRVLASFTLGSQTFTAPDLMQRTGETYVPYYEALVEGKPVTCAVKGTTFDPVLPPTLVIVDFFAIIQFQTTRRITGKRVPIVAAITAHASSIIRLFGPESHGGIGNLNKKVEEEAARRGVTPHEVGDDVYNATSGKIVKIPGLPDMYDYEYFPQQLPFDNITDILKGAYSVLEESDAITIASSYVFESESIEAMKSWFGEWNKELFAVGPLLPAGYGTVKQSSRGATEVEEFLDRVLVEYGTKSAIFISFGTIFWSTTPEYIEEVIEALIEKKFPFIFTYASPYANLPEAVLAKVKDSGIGLLTKWCPQQYILSHPATGWFLSHCGHNSIMESLGAGIPIVAWPFQADQPAAAAYLTEYLNVGFELIEVRNGEHGTKPLLRNGRMAKGTREAVGVEIREIIDACRGPKGDEVRKNAENFKVRFEDAWRDNGIARAEAQALLKKYRV